MLPDFNLLPDILTMSLFALPRGGVVIPETDFPFFELFVVEDVLLTPLNVWTRFKIVWMGGAYIHEMTVTIIAMRYEHIMNMRSEVQI